VVKTAEWMQLDIMPGIKKYNTQVTIHNTNFIFLFIFYELFVLVESDAPFPNHAITITIIPTI